MTIPNLADEDLIEELVDNKEEIKN